MLIPWRDLAADTLDALIESFVLREGSDYGDAEVPLAVKVAQVRELIKRGEVLIVYSELHESVDLLSKQQWRQRQAEQPDEGSW